MSQINNVLRKYVDRQSSEEELLAAAKLELRSSVDDLEFQFDKFADAVESRTRPRMFPGDYAMLKFAAAREVERVIAEQMSLVQIARRIKPGPGVDIRPLPAKLDRVEEKIAILRGVHRDFCRQIDEQIVELQLVEALEELGQ